METMTRGKNKDTQCAAKRTYESVSERKRSAVAGVVVVDYTVADVVAAGGF
jgi:hypothetical protein